MSEESITAVTGIFSEQQVLTSRFQEQYCVNVLGFPLALIGR